MAVGKDSEKIDMSLDDIIELNKKENSSTATALNRTRGQQKIQRNLGLRKQNVFGRGMQQNQQGLNRLKRNIFGSQGYNGINQHGQKQPNNIRGRPGGRITAATLKRVIPLNRKPTIQDAQYHLSPRNGPQEVMIGRAAHLPLKPFRQTGQGPQISMRRIPPQNRGMGQKQQTQKQQRQNTINMNKQFTQQVGASVGQKKQRTRMWRQQSTSSSILTVNLPNPQANKQAAYRRPRIQRFSLTGRKKMPANISRKQPKGVYLGFNFRSIANQTNVTLNERFSSLKICRPSTALRRGGRTVTMG
ncbi:UAP56-interacting factor isoform X2 [Callorhinchus milii]|uniref:UAP56-interacting factor isoform X2 n=1 Tax=Callorhinchus milii TaxID=7868 RepID=UPI00045737C4|nr:UAP56-interacting factor isoform X2 [Callorhinchus milii]|eukprot:gi/632935543/ref/XP_007890451.1/ PREDICTED: UAP56-interacting factor-like isoform X2 [Callorhinchus milii]